MRNQTRWLRSASLIGVLLIFISICTACREKTEQIDILDELDLEKVANILIHDDCGIVKLLVEKEEDVAFLVDQLNQIEVAKAETLVRPGGYRVVVHIFNGLYEAHTYVEEGWNGFYILNRDQIWYDGEVYNVVSGDLGAILTRLASIHAGQQGAS